MGDKKPNAEGDIEFCWLKLNAACKQLEAVLRHAPNSERARMTLRVLDVLMACDGGEDWQKKNRQLPF